MNETGKTNDPNPTFSVISGMNRFRRIVLNGNRAYIVRCTKADAEQVVNFVNSCFSKRLITIHDGDSYVLTEEIDDGSMS